jgi:hypothetical protein
MNELFCIRCNSNELQPLYNGEYKCRGCGLILGAPQVKDFLLEKIAQIEELGFLDVCARCGRELSDPSWCSWCGSEPYLPKDAIQDLKEQIRAIDEIIETGSAEYRKARDEYQKARAGDIQAISHVFQRASNGKEAEWKLLVDLGPAAVPFLIKQFRMNIHESIYNKERSAGHALIEIGDERAIEPMLEALITENNPAILAALRTQWGAKAPRYFGLLLKKLMEMSTFVKPMGVATFIKPSEYIKDTLFIPILEVLVFILDHAGIEVSDNDLLTASAMKDLSYVISAKDTTAKLVRYEDAWGPATYDYPTYEISKTIDCSSLRDAAQMEMKRRALK